MICRHEPNVYLHTLEHQQLSREWYVMEIDELGTLHEDLTHHDLGTNKLVGKKVVELRGG